MTIWFTRRTLVASATAVCLAGSARGADGNGAADLPLSSLNLYDSVDESFYGRLRRVMFAPNGTRDLVNRLWQAYEKTGSYDIAEQAMMFTFSWWRMVPLGAQRIRVARIGQKMAAAIENAFPDQPAGPFFAATFAGLEGLARGVLDALHLLPSNLKRIRSVAEQHPDYLYGMAFVVLGKTYIKLPPFPISTGDLDKGIQYLDQARPMAEGVAAVWNLIYAEAIYLKTNDVHRALAVVDNLANRVTPPNLVTRMLLDSTLQDVAALRRALQDGSYNKYTWDPMLTKLELQL